MCCAWTLWTKRRKNPGSSKGSRSSSPEANEPMELISQHAKMIMEGCKERARDAGLRFQDETLEYIVTNRDMLELSPKAMIPTLYDYWVHDVEVLKGLRK